MSFNEEAARKVIMFLLKDDTYDFKKWIPFIKKFNSEQIQKLFKGDTNYKYPIKNKDIFKNLLQKFDNFEKLLIKWYEKEENFPYLKELWLRYICIEAITEESLNDNLNEEKLTNFLESNNVKYSKWPENVKKEFKEAIEETGCTYIHDEEIKKQLKEEHSGFRKCLDTMDKIVNSLKNIFKDTDQEAQKLFEKERSTMKIGIVGSLFTIIGNNIFNSAKDSINLKALKHCLIKKIQEYDISKVDAKKIANDIINSNCYSENNKFINWVVGEGNGTFLEDDIIHGETFHNSIDADLQLDLNESSDSLSIGKKISAFFKSKMVCGLVAAASLINLGFSAIEFIEISKLTERIAGEEYQKKFDDIKQKFREHINELDLTYDCYNIKEKINYVKNNIENDKKLLVDLITKIKKDIKLLENKKKESILSLGASIFLGGGSIVGSFLTSGGLSLGYAASTVINLISGGINSKNISVCNKEIEKLEKIRKEAEEEEKKIEKHIKDLDLRLKQKEFAFPAFYQDCENLFQKQNKKLNKFFMNKFKL